MALLEIDQLSFSVPARVVLDRLDVGAGARLNYMEGHYHGRYGGVSVVPKATVRVGKHGIYRSDFSLTTARVGKLDLDYEVEADEEALVELTARVFGHGDNAIRIRESETDSASVVQFQPHQPRQLRPGA